MNQLKKIFTLGLLISLSISAFSSASFAEAPRELFPSEPDETHPNFSIGSPLLDRTLSKSSFTPLFSAQIFVGPKKLATYLFLISKEGLLCPQRVMWRNGSEEGPFQFFSTDLKNAGCLDLRAFTKVKVSKGEFKSEANPIPAYLNGIKEEAGKQFTLIAKSKRLEMSANKINSIDLTMNVTGKTHVKQSILSAWVQGTTVINARIRLSEAGVWTISTIQKGAQNNIEEEVPFTQILSHIPKPSLFSTLGAVSFSSVDSPLSLSADKVEFINESQNHSQ